MSNFAMQGWRSRTGSRLGAVVWFLAALLVLHGSLPTAHQLPSYNLRPLFGGLILDSGPTLRPFGISARSPIIQTEARPNAAPPDRFCEQDSPKATLPVSVQPGRDGATARLVSAGGEPPPPKPWRLFEARAPPMIG